MSGPVHDEPLAGEPPMSRLRELRLHGFKTFADPTRFVFQPGVTAVIGPNGSGKSNMADAVRWVLGEQSNRSLRTRRADDVIFAGSQQRKPTGMAEAVLTLDNADGWLPIEYAEVTVGRRAYRSGETEYLVNGTRARLRDVVDLLGAGKVGASSLVVVGQGTVDAALSLRPEERRQLFEEAAGVKNLQVRKNEALARLQRAEENRTRVAYLLGELRPQMRRLALQARHQQEHDQLRQRGRSLVVELHRRREQSLREALGEARRGAAAAAAAADAFRAEQASGRQALEAAEARYWESDAAARSAAGERERTREAVIRLESRAEALAARRTELQATLERATDEAAEATRLLQEPLPADPDLDVVLAEARAAEEAWRAALAVQEAADRELLAAEEALAATRRRDADLIAGEARRAEAAAAAQARVERLSADLQAERERGAELGAEVETLSERTAAAGAAAERLRGELATRRSELDEAHRLAEAARREATEAAERLAAAQAELAALTERAELGGRLGQQLARTGWVSLLDTLAAPDDAWPAIEAVVGGEVADVVLWREASPIEATLDARGTARLLDGRRPPSDRERGDALAAVRASRTLAEWIGRTPGPGIFERVAVAPDLESLLDGWRSLPPGWCAVTEAGDLADGRGILALRGRADPPGGEAARQQARRRDLAGQVEALEDAYAGVADRAAGAVAAAAAAQRRHDEARDVAEGAELAATRAQRELDEARARLARSEESIAELSATLDAARVGSETRAPASPPPAADYAALESRVAAARETQAAAAARRDASRTAWLQARRAADGAEEAGLGAQRGRADLAARRSQLLAILDTTRASLEGLAGEEAACSTSLQEARAADSDAAERRVRADEAREQQRAALLRLERDRSGAGNRMSDLDRAAQAAAVEVTRLEETLAGLAREREIALEAFAGLAEEPAIDPARDARSEPDADIALLDDGALDAEQRRVRRTLAQIGSVNPFAVEEHREVAARLGELERQETDLRGAVGSTRELIARLEEQIGDQFGAAFRAIGERFNEFVQLLFAGGSAALQMGEEDGDDGPAGIEIVVRPPGKRLQRLAMLSGGERALTGVALLFAMLSVNPVPFCILDEVDAALDEANIGRFAEALRRLAERIDFVVITHNRATIEVADTIYGVTMTDAAVSRLVSLRLSDVPAEIVAEASG